MLGIPTAHPLKHLVAAAALLATLVVAALAASEPSAAVPAISSFAIDPGGSITLPARDTITVSGTIECAPGDSALVLFLAEQRSTFGELAQSFGTATLVCTGDPDRWQIALPVHQHARPEEASITAGAIVANCVRLIDDEHFVLSPAR